YSFPAQMLRELFAHGVSLARQFCRERLALLLAVTFLLSSTLQAFSGAAGVNIIVHSEPLHSGRISPKLFGNFVELLDDVVPGLWAEMLNDRAFAGVTRCLNPFYYDGAPNFCDRQWDTNSSWSYDTEKPFNRESEVPGSAGVPAGTTSDFGFNGCRSAKLAATDAQPASLTQSGLGVKSGMTYRCSG